ncbi:MAG: hypothetical protein ACD_23C00971G0001, partial [uncultured bacterium]
MQQLPSGLGAQGAAGESNRSVVDLGVGIGGFQLVAGGQHG